MPCSVCVVFLRITLFFYYLKAKLPLLLSRMNEVAKVFLATNSDYKYTNVSLLMQI